MILGPNCIMIYWCNSRLSPFFWKIDRLNRKDRSKSCDTRKPVETYFTIAGNEPWSFAAMVCALDLPSLTILPAIVATIRDEKLRMHRLYARRISVAIWRQLDDATYVLILVSFRIRAKDHESTSWTARLSSQGEHNFFLVKYDGRQTRSLCRAISRTLAGFSRSWDEETRATMQLAIPNTTRTSETQATARNNDQQRRSSSLPTRTGIVVRGRRVVISRRVFSDPRHHRTAGPFRGLKKRCLP